MINDSVTSSNSPTDFGSVHNSKGEIDNEVEMPQEPSNSESTKGTEKSNLSSLESTWNLNTEIINYCIWLTCNCIFYNVI